MVYDLILTLGKTATSAGVCPAGYAGQHFAKRPAASPRSVPRTVDHPREFAGRRRVSGQRGTRIRSCGRGLTTWRFRCTAVVCEAVIKRLGQFTCRTSDDFEGPVDCVAG
jgi:hypothetical protein